MTEDAAAAAAATAANRPVRQRNAVLHYSDDNPNTFTIKRRNGVIIDAPASVLASLTTATSTSTSTSAATSTSTAAATTPTGTGAAPLSSGPASEAAGQPKSQQPQTKGRRRAGEKQQDAAASSNSSSRRRARDRPSSAQGDPISAASAASAPSSGSVGSAASGRRGLASASASAGATTTCCYATAVAEASAAAYPRSRPKGTPTAASSGSSANSRTGSSDINHDNSAGRRRRRGSASSRGGSDREPPQTASAAAAKPAPGSHSAQPGRRRGIIVPAAGGPRTNSSSSGSKGRSPAPGEEAGASRHSKKPPPRRSSSLGSAAASPSGNSRKRKTRPLSPGERLSGVYGHGLREQEEETESDDGGAGPAHDRKGTVIDHQLFYQPLIEATQRRIVGTSSMSGTGVKLVLQPPGLSYSASGGGAASAAQQSQQSTAAAAGAAAAAASTATAGGAAGTPAWSSLLHHPRPLRVPTRLSNHQELLNEPPVTCWSSRSTSPEQALRLAQLGSGSESGGGASQLTPQGVACGDASGRVHLVSLRPRTSVVASVETSASKRERQRTISSRKATVTFPNTVLAAAWSGNDSLVAVLTETELECIDLLLLQDRQPCDDSSPSGATTSKAPAVVDRRERAGAARIPFSLIRVSDQLPVSAGSASGSASALSQPVLEWQGDRLLWVVGNGPTPSLEEIPQGSVARSSSPLVFVVERGGAPLRPIPLPCLTATWDDPSSEGCDRVLALIRRGKDSLALVRYDIHANQTLQSVVLSLSGSVRTVHMQKHHVLVSNGSSPTTATLVTLCTPRGIHIHSAETLECLSIVGESVALHGKSVSWESCQLVPEPSIDGRRLNSSAAATNKGAQKQRCWWELRRDDPNYRANNMTPPSYRLVAAPQPFKEPKELQSTLHIWRAPPSEARNIQARFAFHLQHATTLPIPASPGGVLGWTMTCDRIGGWRMLGVSAEFGLAYEWSSRLLSDFPGREYPVGYKLLSDNIEYFEDEDEMDQGMVYYEADDSSPASPSLISPLFATPPRPASSIQSKELEQVLALSVEDAPIQVLLTNEEAEREEMEIMKCPPLVIQPVDRDRVCEVTAAESLATIEVQGSAMHIEPQKKAPLLVFFPQYQEAIEVTKTQYDPTLGGRTKSTDIHLSVPTDEEQEAAVASANAVLLKRGKKSRVASVETVLQASVVPNLRAHMNRLTSSWGDGSGSTCAAILEALSPATSRTRAPVRAHSRTSQTGVASSSERLDSITEEGADGSRSLDAVIEVDASIGLATDTENATDVERQMHMHYSQVGRPEAMQLESATHVGEPSMETEVDVPGISPGNDEKLPGTPSHGIENATSESTNLGSERSDLRQSNARALDRMSPSVASKVSAEERELALELLLLSPGHQRNLPTNGSIDCFSTNSSNKDVRGQEGLAKTSFLCVSDSIDVNEESIVTPSETSPTFLPGSFAPTEANSNIARSVAPATFCAACRGRMVVHGCGKREKPIDYDAIERAERERKEREEAEKQQRRTEKRRAAEARRREARKKKKEEDDQKRFEEEEHLRMLEAERLKQLEAQRTRKIEVERHGHARTSSTPRQELLHGSAESRDFDNWTQESFQPSFSPLKPHVGTRQEPHSAVSAAHAFRITDSLVGPQGLFRPSGASNPADSMLNSPERTREEVEGMPSAARIMGNGVDSPSARIDVGRTFHGFSHKSDVSASKDAIDSDGPEPRVSQIEGSAYASHNPSTDRDRIAEDDSDARADAGMNAQDTNSRWSNVAGRPTTYATSAVLDVTKLEPSAPLSTADALEALAGLANSLPAVPTNVSHNFSSTGWTRHSYEQVPSGTEFSHHQQSHQYYEEQHGYVYHHTGGYAYSTDVAAGIGQTWDAAPSIFGQATGHAYQATDEHSSATHSAPPTQETTVDTSCSSVSQSLPDYAPASSI